MGWFLGDLLKQNERVIGCSVRDISSSTDIFFPISYVYFLDYLSKISFYLLQIFLRGSVFFTSATSPSSVIIWLRDLNIPSPDSLPPFSLHFLSFRLELSGSIPPCVRDSWHIVDFIYLGKIT